MKNNTRSPSLFLLAPLAFLVLNFHPVSAQTLSQDTLAVRILLDENGLTTVPVSEVSKTDTSHRIVSLDLSGRKILKVTSEIGSITALRSLVLSDNLIDSLPAEIWGLDQLVSLDVSGNHLASLDTRVGQLGQLLFLSLRGNGLTSLPAGLFSLEHLENLYLSRNLLDTLPEEVANLIFLKYLNLSGNRLRTVPYTVGAMNQLDSLDLSGNLMTTLPDVITELTTTTFHLDDNRLCGLSAQVQTWADEIDPNWSSTQTCGIAVRPGNILANGRSMRAWTEDGDVRLEFPVPAQGNSQVTYEAVLMDASGRIAFRDLIASRDRVQGGTLRIRREELGSHRGGLWAELRSEGRVLTVVPVLASGF